jgi:AraC-like DNA-binding protein
VPPEDLWTQPPPAQLPVALRPYLRSLHGYGATGLTPAVHRGLPGRSLTLVLALDGGLTVAATAAAWAAGQAEHRTTVLGGLHTEPALVVQPGRWCGLQLDVSPLGARRLLGAPAAALPTDSFDGAAMLGPGVDRLHEQLAAAPGWEARYALVLRWLLDRLAVTEPGRTPTAVVRAWRQLERSRGAVGVGDLAEQLGMDRRRLARVFGAELGVTPKVAARLIRFEGARRGVAAAAARTGSLDLSGLAVRHGYYDHAHLVREFTQLAGLSPTAWLAAERANVQADGTPPAAGSAA